MDDQTVERTLYGFWLSPYMSQVAQILLEAELPYRYERVSPYQGSTRRPEHKERNAYRPVLWDRAGSPGDLNP